MAFFYDFVDTDGTDWPSALFDVDNTDSGPIVDHQSDTGRMRAVNTNSAGRAFLQDGNVNLDIEAVEIDLTWTWVGPLGNNDYFGITLRGQGTGWANSNGGNRVMPPDGYVMRFRGASPRLRLRRVVNGTATNLTELTSGVSVGAGVTSRLRFRITNDGSGDPVLEWKLWEPSQEAEPDWTTVTDTHADAFDTAGDVRVGYGIAAGGESTGEVRIDEITVTDLDAVAGVPFGRVTETGIARPFSTAKSVVFNRVIEQDIAREFTAETAGPFLVDTFTDTDNTALDDHTPDVGGVWEPLDFTTSGVGPGGDGEIVSNTLRTTSNVRSPTYRNTADPGADEYDIHLTWSFHGDPQTNRFHWLCWRMTETGTSDTEVDRYMLVGDGNVEQWELFRTVDGSGNRVLLDVQADDIAGTVRDIRVEVRTGSMTVYIDNVLTLESDDTEITQRGRIGIGTARGGGAHWVDDLSAEAVDTAGLVPFGQVTEQDVARSFAVVQPQVIPLGRVSESGVARAWQAGVSVPELVDLQLVALAPVLGHGPALAPVRRDRVALAPEVAHGDTEAVRGHGPAGPPTT